MFESLENALQIGMLFGCAGVAAVRAVALRSRAWTLLAFFYGSWGLGDVYWLVCLLFFGQTPQISVVSDLSWYASYIFLYMLLREAAPPVSRRESRLLPWLGPVFAAGMAAFFLRWGEAVSNLVYGALMGLLLFSAIRRLQDSEHGGEKRFLCALILAFCLLEYALWTASCFFTGDSWRNPYYWFDLLLTLCFPLFLPALGKAVGE